MEYVAFNLVIDDIVFPDGTTSMRRLGGGGPQAAYGMRLFASQIGLAGSVGPDFSQNLWEELRDMEIDLNGIRQAKQPTPRAWQILEDDGRRTQIWRVGEDSLAQHLKRRIDLLPQTYRQARAFHLGIHPLDADLDFLASLHSLGGLLSVEIYKSSERPLKASELRALLKSADIFSMNALEAASLLGKTRWEEQLDVLFASGARLVTLRYGEQGSLTCDGRQAIHIPAVPVANNFPVGAGNAFCGGFLAGWLQTQDLARAAGSGTLAAAFFIDKGYKGVSEPDQIDRALEQLAGRAEKWR